MVDYYALDKPNKYIKDQVIRRPGTAYLRPKRPCGVVGVSFNPKTVSGHEMGPILEGSISCTGMVILRDFPQTKVYCLDWSFNDPSLFGTCFDTAALY